VTEFATLVVDDSIVSIFRIPPYQYCYLAAKPTLLRESGIPAFENAHYVSRAFVVTVASVAVWWNQIEGICPETASTMSLWSDGNIKEISGSLLGFEAFFLAIMNT